MSVTIASAPEATKNETIVSGAENAAQVRRRFPDRVPIIVTRHSPDGTLPVLPRNKFLPPHDFTLGQFQHILRRYLKLKPSEALYLFAQDKHTKHAVFPPISMLVSQLDKEYASAEDGFLHLTYSSENAFGNARTMAAEVT